MASSMQVLLCVALLSVVAVSATDHKEESSLLQKYEHTLDAGASSSTEGSPVARVVKLLQEMQGQVSKEMGEDEEIYEKVKCWCNNNEYEKKMAVEAAEKKIDELESEIERLTAQSGELNEKLKELKEELAQDTEELNEAAALRKKQLAEFHGGEVDSIQAVENLKAAIVVLGKHHGAFPQLNLLALHDTTTRRMKSDGNHEKADSLALDRFMEHKGFDGQAPVSAADVDAQSKAFLQQNRPIVGTPTTKDGFSAKDMEILRKAKKLVTNFMQTHNPSQPYAAQSGEILGIMKQMKETMEGDLSESQKEESARAKAFAELRDAKEAEIAAGEKQIEDKTAELADTDVKLADAKEDIGETKKALDEDQKFLVNLKTTCGTVDKDAALRKKARLDEIQAISETIEILTNDEARDSMNTTFNFLQVSSEVRASSRLAKKARAEASSLLRKAAASSKDPMLSILATKVQLDAFTEVKKAIDDMIATLKTQQSDEVKKKDYCNAAIQENEMETARQEDLQGDLTHAIEDLETELKELKEAIGQAKDEIAEAQLNMQRANENRKTESLEFQRVVTDQRATEEVLKKALDRLATFYDSELLQMKKQQPPGEAAHLKGSVKNSGSSGVMSMIEKLIHDCREIEKESIDAENEAQVQYEIFTADTNAFVKEKSDAVVTMSARKAGAEKELTEKQEELEATMTELEELAKMNGDLHEECDYVMKNFDIRQKARASEIEALQQAKQILSGAM